MATKKKEPLSNDEMVKRMAKVLKDKQHIPNGRAEFDKALKVATNKPHVTKRG
jgi:hypothetical protein